MGSAGGQRHAWAVALTALVVLAGAAPGAAGSGPPSTPPGFFGVNAGTLWPNHGALPVATHVAAMRAAGLQSARAVAFWSAVEPDAPSPATGRHTFRWDYTDAIAAALARRRMRWYVVLGLSTYWGSVVPGSSVSPPRPGPFAAYAAAVARRYGRGGAFWREHAELPYAPVATYEVYNEPNLAAFWPPVPQPDRYADLYLAARAAVRGADPAAAVVVGGLDHTAPSRSDGSAFLRAMYAARPALRGGVDAVGVHVYPPSVAAAERRVADVRATLDALGERDVPLHLNEVGWPTAGVLPLLPAAISEAARAENMRALVARLAGSDCGIAALLPYAWVTAEDNPADQSAWFGLWERGGAAAKPSGRAFAGALAAPRAATTVCGRPDLAARPPGPVAEAGPPQAFALSAARRCRAGTRRVRAVWNHGPDPEPLDRFALAFGRKGRTYADPDAGGPRAAATTATLTIPRRARRTTLRVTGFDALGRERAAASVAVRRCRR